MANIPLRILLLTTVLNYCCVSGKTNQQYLVKANSSLVVTQIKQDGSQTKTSVYLTDNFRKTVTPYSDPVAELPATQNPTAKPALGNLAFFERIAYCYGAGQSKNPTLLFVNDTKKQIITTEFNSIGINEQCERIVMADIDGDSSNEVVLLTSLASNNSVEVVVLQTTGTAPTDTQVKVLYQVQLTGAYPSYKYSLVAGKIKKGKSATDLVAVTAFTQTSVLLWVLENVNNTLKVIVDQAVVASNLYNLYDYCVPMDAVVAYLSDVSGGTSTLVIAYQESIVGVTTTIKLKSYQIEGNNLTESALATTSTVTPSAPPVNITLSVGKIQTTTARESVVMTMGPYNGPFHLYVLKANNGQLDGHTLWTFTGDYSTFSNQHQLSSQVLSDTADMIAVIDSYVTDKYLEQKLYQLQVQGNKITGKILKTWENSPYSYGYVSSGDMIGLNVFLGPSTQYTANQLKSMVVDIAAPPYHLEFSDVYYGNPYVSWQSYKSNMTQISTRSSTSWTTSDNLRGTLELFDSSTSRDVETSTEQMVENEYEKSVTIVQELRIEAMFDEVFLVRDFTYTVTEIPVYIGKKLSGHILIVQPQDKYTNELSITTASNLYYNASYVLGDVRTYPTGAPSDIAYNMFTAKGTVGYGLSYESTVTVETMNGEYHALTREQTTRVESEANTRFPFETGSISGSIGGYISHSSDYRQSSVNTSLTQITKQIQIEVSIPGFQASSSGEKALQYNVNPYIYWDSTGVLHITWSVDLPKNDWNNFISGPDPALLMPYRLSIFDGYTGQKCVFELFTEPRSVPESGTSVIISVPIHNYSFRPALNTTVEFYWTSSANIPPSLSNNSKWKLIGTQHIPSIGGFKQENVFISWIPKKNLKSAIIIVQLKPSGSDFDTDNNLGYSVWPQDENNPFVQNINMKSKALFKSLYAKKKAFNDANIINWDNIRFSEEVGYQKELHDASRCSGNMIGEFVYKINCLHRGGFCCTSNANGSGPASKADSKKEYCGYCFTKGTFATHLRKRDTHFKDELWNI